jgi:hypothetical protein
VASDPYSILGLPWGASRDAITAAFRRLAMLHHPDRNPGDPSAEARFKLISAAYQKLKESGWKLPAATRSSPSSAPAPPSAPSPPHSAPSGPPPERPEFWPDGTRIHYPSAQDIDELQREANAPTFLPALRAAGMWISKASAYFYFFILAASAAVFVVVVLYHLLTDPWRVGEGSTRRAPRQRG